MKTRAGVANRNPKPTKAKDETIFSFRLPVDYIAWFNQHAPEGNSRHLRMQAFVVEHIRSDEQFNDTTKDEMSELKERIEAIEEQVYYSRDEIRGYIESLMRDNQRMATMQQVGETYQNGDIPDDLIDNMLEGLGR